MINRKGFIKVLSVLAITGTMLIGCGQKVVEPLRVPTAEEAVDKFNQYNIENNVDEMAKLYSDVYIDSVGYDLATIQKILKNSRKNVEVSGSELINIEDYDTDIKKAKIKISSKVEEKEEIKEYDYAIIKEEDGWSISPDGVIRTENYDIPEYAKKELNLFLAKKITLFEGGIIRVNVLNDTKTQFMFGKDGDKCEIIVETSVGTYVTTMDEPTKLEKDVNSYFLARMTDLDGEIKKVTVTNIYEIDKDENIIEESKKDIVVYEKK